MIFEDSQNKVKHIYFMLQILYVMNFIFTSNVGYWWDKMDIE